MSLINQTVLIVGGSQGMGLGAARKALQAGAKVVIVGRSKSKLDEVAKELGDTCRSVVGDIENINSHASILEQTGRFDHVFISASPGGKTGFHEQYDSIEESYLHGKFWCTFKFLQQAIKFLNPAGSVTLLSGGLSVRPHPAYSLVSVAFGAIESLGKALAVAIAPVRVNVIRPSNIEKDASAFHTIEEQNTYIKRSSEETLLKRIGTGADIGDLVVHLMTNEFMTGQVIEIDGGLSIKFY